MTRGAPVTIAVADEDVARAIDEWIAGDRHQGSVVGLRRRPWEYSTSAPLEFVTAVMDDGREHNLVLKYLGPADTTEKARRVKPSFVINPRREIEVYRRLLAPLQIGPSLVGSNIDLTSDSYWLLLEHVDGPRLTDVGELTAWAASARWLGALHARLEPMVDGPLHRAAGLMECDREWYRVWMDRALQFFASDDPSPSRHGRSALRWLAGRYDCVIERLVSLPLTLIHGDFYPSNVLVIGPPDNPRPCPIDWEAASIGPGVLDLAALSAGNWSEQDRRELTAAYAAGAGSNLAPCAIGESLAYAHIHLAVQQLGWFGRRRRPAAHARDWLADAVDRAEALNL